MAWRIDEMVIRGEIDNRVRGCVLGRLWLVGREQPVELQLIGNCWRDLAGRRLEFINPRPKPGLDPSFAPLQVGTVGDITASRKVKVPDIPLEQIGEYYAARKPFPWHWANSLYLEWYSKTNGRVVIEAANFELKVMDAPAWEMSLEEEVIQHTANTQIAEDFMDELLAEDAIDTAAQEGEERNEKPQTEAEAEAQLERSDRLMDRIQVRQERESEKADPAKILAEELARMRAELDEHPLTAAGGGEEIDALNRAIQTFMDEATAEWSQEGVRHHPLSERARELLSSVEHEIETGQWLPADAGEEHPVAELIRRLRQAAAKLAGALDASEWPPELDHCAGVNVRLKRARICFDDALRALESCQEEKLVPPPPLGVMLAEIAELAHDVDAMIADLRERLARESE